MERRVVLVVPCFNEAARLPGSVFLDAARARPWLSFIFVDDGSSDGTAAVLNTLAEKAPQQVTVSSLSANSGKGAAVRSGMLEAIRMKPAYAGYWDADLATPLDEIEGFLEVLEQNPAIDVVIGSRVRLLGRSINRNPLRHYLSRVFATAASLTLELPVYDTQCGAKMFRVRPGIEALFAEPFMTRWLCDVEVLARLSRERRLAGGLQAADVVYELPLRRWADIRGSKVKPFDFFRALAQLARIRRSYFGRSASDVRDARAVAPQD
jgi:glycosyltransferase involved in cell wall biosynthesis